MVRENLLPQINSELYELLNVLGQDYISALPKNIYKNILENRDLDYTNKFDINTGITEENFSKETINILLGFDLKYWSTYAEKQRKISIYKENERKYQTEIREKYNPEKLFKKEKTIAQSKMSIDEEKQENNNLVPAKISIWSRIKNFLRNRK